MYRAILEGTAYGVRHNVETLRDIGAAPKRIFAVGGGAKYGLLQILSDVAGIPQVVQQQTIGAAYGDAFLARLSSGIIRDPSALMGSWIQTEAFIEPDPKYSQMYSETYAVYQNLYGHAKGELHDLARLGVARSQD